MKHWILASLNWVVAALLVAGGAILIRCPQFVGSAESASTLTGAVFGAAALFIGAEISKLDQRARTKDDLEDARKRLRVALMAELVRICVNHMQSATFFRTAANALGQGVLQAGPAGVERYMPAEPVVYQALLAQITSLPAAEIDALATCYGNMSLTRKSLRESVGNPALGLLNAEHLAKSFENDCANAAEVVALLAPQRKVLPVGEKVPVLLTAMLRKAAGLPEEQVNNA